MSFVKELSLLTKDKQALKTLYFTILTLFTVLCMFYWVSGMCHNMFAIILPHAVKVENNPKPHRGPILHIPPSPPAATGSLALRAFTFLTLFDLANLVTSLLSHWAEKKAPSLTFSYGFHRVEVMSVFTGKILCSYFFYYYIYLLCHTLP